MAPKHVAASMAALSLAGTAAAAPIAASAGSGTAFDAARMAARKAGATEERTRIGAILNHTAAAGRGKLAAHLAFKTDLGADAAGEMLAASATEGAGATAVGTEAAAETIDWNEIVAGFNSTVPGALGKEGTR